MKKAQDRASVIEEALGSFAWLSQIGVWAAFVLAGLSFLFWAGLEINVKNVFSFAFLALAAFPLRESKEKLYALRSFTAIAALLFHSLVLHIEYEKIPSVLLIIPAFLFIETVRGNLWKVVFASALWSIHAYWCFGAIPTPREATSSLMGAAVTLILVFVFNGIHSLGRTIAARKLDELKGKIDFRGQRVHASRLQILGELSAALVHELSNPVTNLQGFFSQIAEAPEFRLNVHLREVSSRIEANLSRMRDLLLGFRSFSRLQPTENSSFKISELFRDLELLSQHAFKSQQVQLTVLRPEEDFDFLGNRVEIGQVMMNFLLNALSSVKDAKEKRVFVGLKVVQKEYILFVEDSGPGVAEHLKEKIFRPFFSTKGDEGSGLGLYIAKIIADHHDCKIRVTESQLYSAHGARFELVFSENKRVFAKELDKVA